MNTKLKEQGFSWTSFQKVGFEEAKAPKQFYVIGEVGGAYDFVSLMMSPQLRVLETLQSIPQSKSTEASVQAPAGVAYQLQSGETIWVKPAPNMGLVCMGNTFGSGLWGIRQTRFWIELKKQYPNQVILIASARDLKRLRLMHDLKEGQLNQNSSLFPDLDDISFEEGCVFETLSDNAPVPYYGDENDIGMQLTQSPLPKMQWALDVTGSKDTFKFVKLELAHLMGAPVVDEECYDFIVENFNDANGLWMQYLMLSDLLRYDIHNRSLYTSTLPSDAKLRMNGHAFNDRLARVQQTRQSARFCEEEPFPNWVAGINEKYHNNLNAWLKGNRCEAFMYHMQTRLPAHADQSIPPFMYQGNTEAFFLALSGPSDQVSEEKTACRLCKANFAHLVDYDVQRIILGRHPSRVAPLILKWNGLENEQGISFILAPGMGQRVHSLAEASRDVIMQLGTKVYEKNPLWRTVLIIATLNTIESITLENQSKEVNPNKEDPLTATYAYVQGFDSVSSGNAHNRQKIFFFAHEDNSLIGQQLGPYASVLGKTLQQLYILIAKRGNTYYNFKIRSGNLRKGIDAFRQLKPEDQAALEDIDQLEAFLYKRRSGPSAKAL